MNDVASQHNDVSTQNDKKVNCGICRKVIKNGTKLENCVHNFCFSCIKTWTKRRAACPTCDEAFSCFYYNIKDDRTFEIHRLKAAADASNGNTATGRERTLNDEHETCPICLDIFSDKSTLEDCLHSFCFKCILKWHKIDNRCPLCKTIFSKFYHKIQDDRTYDEYDLALRNEEYRERTWPNPNPRLNDKYLSKLFHSNHRYFTADDNYLADARHRMGRCYGFIESYDHHYSGSSDDDDNDDHSISDDGDNDDHSSSDEDNIRSRDEINNNIARNNRRRNNIILPTNDDDRRDDNSSNDDDSSSYDNASNEDSDDDSGDARSYYTNNGRKRRNYKQSTQEKKKIKRQDLTESLTSFQ